jgi:hypothetical protein
VQEFVLFVLGDMLCVLHCISNDCLCLNQVCWMVAPKTKRCQEQVKLAEREDVVWQAGKT